MRRLIRIFTTPSARSSAIFYFGNFSLGIGRYFFHLLLLRLLTPGEYGEFLAYLSLLYLLGIPNNTVGSVVVKFVAQFRGEGDDASINRFFYFLLKKMAPVTFVLGSLIIILKDPLSSIFKAHPLAFVILGISVFTSLVGSLVRSYLVAFQRFTASILIGVVEIFFSISLAFIFIKANLAASGAVLAQLIAGLVSLLLIILLLHRHIFPPLPANKTKFSLGHFTVYSLVFAIGSLSLISTDILVVRSVMSEHLSGLYSSLSIIGRSLYFALGPIIGLILPIAAHRHAASRSTRSVFLKLGGAIFILGLLALTTFTVFPQVVITLISSRYLEAAPLLPFFAISMFLFSLNLFIISYFMAVGFPKVNLLLALASVAQPTLIFFFHRSLEQVVTLNLSIETVLFILLLWQLKIRKVYDRFE